MQRTITQTLRLAIGISFFAFILIGMNDGAVGVLLPGMQTTYHIWLLLLGIVPIGFGVAMLDAGLNSYIASLPNNTALLNYLHAFYGTGALLGPLVASSFLALSWVWNSVYFVWIGTAIFLFIGIGLAFPRRERTAHKEEQKAEGNALLLTLRQRVVWLAALFLLFYVGTEVSLGSWSFSFLTQERHGQILFSGWIVSGYWVGLTLGRLLLGKLARRIGNRRLIEVCLGGVVAGMVCLWALPHLIAAAFALFFNRL